MKVQVRPYQSCDHDAIVALWRAVFPDAPPRNDPVRDIARKLAVQPELFLVALAGGRVAGTVMGGFDGHRGWVHLVAVDPRLRRSGVGSALMREAEARLAARGCPKLNLQVRGDNAGVVPFYESLGYRVEDRISLGKVLPPGEVP
jgi:ribosomal protein S18 acetylase RimI-like enzyme